MNETTQPGPLEVRLSDQLGPLPATEYSLFYEAPGDDDNEGWQEVVDAPGYTAKQMREYAAQQVAAERERWRDAVMMALDSNGQAHAIVADATRA